MNTDDLFDVSTKTSYTRSIADYAEVWNSVMGRASLQEQRNMRAVLTMWDLCGRPELGDHDDPSKDSNHTGLFIYETIVNACNVFED